MLGGDRNRAKTYKEPQYIIMSNMLIDDRPIMFLPMLAKALGSCERAIVLQQIHWLSRQPNSGIWDDDGLHWVWGTYEEWCRDYFAMWTPVTLKHHIRNLEKQGVLISAQLRAHEHDQTKFYRVNYAHELLNTGMGQHVIPSNRQDAVASNEADVIPSINRTKTSSKNTQKKNGAPAPKEEKKNYRPDEYSDIILG